MFTLELFRDGVVATIAVRGALDRATCDELRRVAFAALAGGASSLCIDFEDLEFIDAGGLAVLAHLHEVTDGRGGQTTLRRPPPLAVRMLQITGLDDRFAIEPPARAQPS